MPSPLSGLCEVLKQVKYAATSYPSQRLNEATTRAVLIDPVLRALGWDVADPALVEVERPISAGTLSGRLDYLLNTDNADKPIVVEAKKLGEKLQDYFPQVIAYACTLKIDNLFLTDGMKWLHFTDVSASNQKPPAGIDLGTAEGSDLTKAAAFLVERLDSALYLPDSQKAEELWEQKYNSLEKKLQDMEQNIATIANGNVNPMTVETLQQSFHEPWLLLDGSWDAKKKKPSKLRMPNGHVVEVRSWTQILTEACKYCLTEKQELLQQLPIADRTGRATKLISTVRPPSNLNSDSIVIGDKTLYVCTNYSANDCVANAGFMFSKLGNTTVKAGLLLAQ